MSRGIGEVETIQSIVPDILAVVLALLTQLGDIWFLTVVFAAFYWYNTPSQDNIATLAGVWIAGMGLYKGLKEVFTFPRPDQPLLETELLPRIIQPLYELTAFASGYGFPSGHAVNTTIVYFGLAYILDIGTLRQRTITAAAIVGTVGFTRIALGVHFLVDVIVGVAVGLAVLYFAWQLIQQELGDKPTIAFSLAIVFSGFFVITSDLDPDALFLLGAALGAFSGWQLVMLGRAVMAVSRPSRATYYIFIRGGSAILAFIPLVLALEYFPVLSAYTAGGAVGIVVSAIVIVPVLRYSEHASRVGAGLKFWIQAVFRAIRSILSSRF